MGIGLARSVTVAGSYRLRVVRVEQKVNVEIVHD
jgi:hypothetical protein